MNARGLPPTAWQHLLSCPGHVPLSWLGYPLVGPGTGLWTGPVTGLEGTPPEMTWKQRPGGPVILRRRAAKILSSFPRCANHSYPYWFHTGFMKTFWCKPFADWLKRDHMDNLFRNRFSSGYGTVSEIFILIPQLNQYTLVNSLTLP